MRLSHKRKRRLKKTGRLFIRYTMCLDALWAKKKGRGKNRLHHFVIGSIGWGKTSNFSLKETSPEFVEIAVSLPQNRSGKSNLSLNLLRELQS